MPKSKNRKNHKQKVKARKLRIDNERKAFANQMKKNYEEAMERFKAELIAAKEESDGQNEGLEAMVDTMVETLDEQEGLQKELDELNDNDFNTPLSDEEE